MRIVASIAAVFIWMMAAPAAADFDTAMAAYRNGNFGTAHAEFLPLAKAGDQRAQLALAVILHKGHGFDVNYEEALTWYRMAADQGDMTAQNNLGVMYRRGEGIQKDPKQAFTFFWAAAIQGHARAGLNVSHMYQLGEGTPKNRLMAYVWLELAVTDLPESGKYVATNRRAKLAAEMDVEAVIRADYMAKSLRKMIGDNS